VQAQVARCRVQPSSRLECSPLNHDGGELPERCGPTCATLRHVLRELRGHHGGPHLGTRALALALALLLAAPLTVLVYRVVAAVLRTVL
jgi:hypothetical protein